MADSPRKIELEVEIDAPLAAVWKALTEGREIANWFAPEATTRGSGLGSEVTLSWGEGLAFAVQVVACEPGVHLRWAAAGEGAPPLVTDFFLSATGGKTVLRLVHSGFGPGDEWDDMIEGLRAGWTYFLHHLRVHLQQWAGRTRTMISRRVPSTATREVLWRHLTTGAGGLVLGATGALITGGRYEVRLADTLRTTAVAEVVVQGRAFALRLPQLEAILFVELESGSTELTVGVWLSVYDEAWARTWRAQVESSFAQAVTSVAP